MHEVAFPDGLQPLATFKARGKTYYLEKGAFPDQALLERFSPPNPQAAELELMQAMLQAQGAAKEHKD